MIVHWALFSSIIYLVLIMPLVGCLILDLVCCQFSTEMVKQQMVTKLANLRAMMIQMETARSNIEMQQ